MLYVTLKNETPKSHASKSICLFPFLN